jgi:[acyl-carrier-protein] S-malonyltransferase
MDPQQLKFRLPNAALALRGYNVTNLGRSRELLTHPVYAGIVDEELRRASRICTEVTGRRTDLVDRVRRGRETTLKTYADAVGLVTAMDLTQLRLLGEHFGIDYTAARMSFGYSLGEIAALIAGGVIEMDEALRIPLTLAPDCVALAEGVTLGILFSRGEELPLDEIRRVCLRINAEGQGVIAVSAYLSPNSLLIMGQGTTMDRFDEQIRRACPHPVHLRRNTRRWPPLHTPIVWERNVSDRAAFLMHTMKGGFTAPKPQVLSLVTGSISYDDYNCREIIHGWTDHPQRLWDAIYETLAMGITTVIHVGPDPNIIPATFKRLADNVAAQTKASFGMRALSAVAQRGWLRAVLPARTALLRAPAVQHVILEDWLLAQSPAKTSAG